MGQAKYRAAPAGPAGEGGAVEVAVAPEGKHGRAGTTAGTAAAGEGDEQDRAAVRRELADAAVGAVVRRGVEAAVAPERAGAAVTASARFEHRLGCRGGEVSGDQQGRSGDEKKGEETIQQAHTERRKVPRPPRSSAGRSMRSMPTLAQVNSYRRECPAIPRLEANVRRATFRASPAPGAGRRCGP